MSETTVITSVRTTLPRRVRDVPSPSVQLVPDDAPMLGRRPSVAWSCDKRSKYERRDLSSIQISNGLTDASDIRQ